MKIQGLTDMHCHVLPGVDDGPKTMDESRELLLEAVRQGISTMIVTPHFHPGRYQVEAEKALAVLEQVREMCLREGIGVTLLPGQECCWYSGLIDKLRAGEVLTMNGTRYLLVEFDPDVLYSVIKSAVREISMAGCIPILAHFERYGCLMRHPERLDEIRDSGAMLQLNFDRLLEKHSFFHRNPFIPLVLDGTVDFLGSDTHGMKFRPLHVKQAAERLISLGDPEIAELLLVRNPARLTR